MTCKTCRHAIQEAIRESERVWGVALICCENIDNVRQVKPDHVCDNYEREPGACDEQGRGDSGNWN